MRPSDAPYAIPDIIIVSTGPENLGSSKCPPESLSLNALNFARDWRHLRR